MKCAMTRSITSAGVRGFSMIEMLVALIVLSLGMLGVANLFIITIRSSSSAISRLHAVNLASDLADRIRSNRTAGAAYAGGPANNNCFGQAIGAVNCSPAGHGRG